MGVVASESWAIVLVVIVEMELFMFPPKRSAVE